MPPGALASRNFRLLLGCDVLSGTGSAVAVIAIPFAVLAIGGSAADVGYVAAAALLSMVVFLLLGGVVADRMPRHRVMMAANLVQGAAQAGSAVLVLTGHAQVAELLGLSALRGAGLGFYYPASQGLLPQTVPAAHLAQANAIDRVGRNTAQIGGAALGGILVAAAGSGWGLAADAISFAGAAALRAGMRFPARSPAEPAATAEAGLLGQMREGWREFLARRWLWVIVAEFTVLSAITSAAISVLGPLVAHDSLGGARSWGFILSGYSVGAVAGGAIMIRYRPERMLLVGSIAAGVFSVLLFALAVPLSVPLVAAAAFLVGVSTEVFLVNWVTTMQQEIPHGLLSRLSAFDAMGSFALAPAGVAVAGPVAAAVGVGPALAGGGLIIVVLTAVVLAVPEVRRLRRRVPGPDPASAVSPAGKPRKRPTADLPAEPG